MSVSKLAQKIIDAYAHDPEGVTREECASIGLSEGQAEAITTVLGKGAEGAVTEEERTLLASAGFDKATIDEIAGVDGRTALRERAKWLGDHVVRKFGQRDYRNSIREELVRELGDMGPVAESAVPALIIQLKRGNPEAAEALGNIGPGAKDAVPALIAALKDEDGDVRMEVVRTLGRIGPAAKDAVPALIAALKDEDGDVRMEVVRTLREIGPAAEDAVPALITALKDEIWDVRGSAANALREIGPAAEDAVPALITALKDEIWDVRGSAADALREIGPAAVPALIAVLKDEDSDVRMEVVRTLGRIGPAAKDAVLEIVRSYRNADPGPKSVIDWALEMIGPAALGSVPDLILMLGDEKREVRRAAADALYGIGFEVPEISAALLCVKAEDSDVAFRVALSLVMTGTETEATYPVLIDGLKDAERQDSAAEAICELYLRADEAVRVKIRGRLVAMIEADPDIHPLIKYMLKALSGKGFKVSEGKINIWPGVTTKSFGNETVITFCYDNGKMFCMTAGRLQEKGGSEVSVYDFIDKFEIIVGVQPKDVSRMMSGLLLAYQILPRELFRGIERFRYKKESICRAAYRAPDEIELSTLGYEYKQSIIHELTHHWGITLERDKVSLFNRISWKDIDKKRYISAFTYAKNHLSEVPDREDFDRADFQWGYSLCNPDEDLASFVQEYVGNGKRWRVNIREHMAQGNFELAAKYLFVKHVMPFAGREYDVSDDSPAITIEEVKEKYLAAKDTSKTDPGTWDVILEIEKSIPKP